MNSTVKMLGGLVLALGIIIPGAVFANTHEDKESKVPRGSATQVTITNGGRVLVGGAKVTAVSGSTVTATTLLGGTTLSWTITTDSTTTFSNRGGSNALFSDIAVGDTVSVAGSLNSGSSLSVRATTIKEWSNGVEGVKVSGTVSSLNGTNMSLVLTNKSGGTTSVQVTTATVITVNGSSVGFTALVVGDKLKVSGAWNADNSVFTATKLHVVKKEAREDKRFGQHMKQLFSGQGSPGVRSER